MRNATRPPPPDQFSILNSQFPTDFSRIRFECPTDHPWLGKGGRELSIENSKLRILSCWGCLKNPKFEIRNSKFLLGRMGGNSEFRSRASCILKTDG